MFNYIANEEGNYWKFKIKKEGRIGNKIGE